MGFFKLEKKESMQMEEITREQLAELGNQWMKMQFITREQHFARLFTEMPIFYYMTMVSLQNRLGMGKEKERLYLRQICEEMDLPITRVSKMVQGMQDKGYVYWNHDDSGRPGTYITISETGHEVMEKQQAKIADFFERAIRKYGYDRFEDLLRMRGDFNAVMDGILAEEE